MNLTDLIKNIKHVDEKAIIFQEHENNPHSDIIIAYPDNDGIIKEEKGRKYFYLIEVFLAKEFIEDWIAGLDYTPTFEETAQRLYEYAINDA